MTTSLSITPGQEKQLKRFAEDAAGKAVDTVLKAGQVAVDVEGMQRVFARGDELQDRIEKIVAATLREFSLTNEFANEEVPSKYGYLSGYRGPKPIAEQLAILRQFFPKLGDADEGLATQPKPAGSEGYFAIPRWQLIAPTYGEAVQKVLDALKKQRGKLENYRKGKLGPEYIRETDRKRLAFERLGREQEGHDVLVVAAQFGIRHRGRSVRRARAVMFGNEFGLGAFENLIKVLTHPERLQHQDDLWIDCPGDEYSFDADGRFGYAPCVRFGDGLLGFGALGVGRAGGGCGSASAFFPQQK